MVSNKWKSWLGVLVLTVACADPYSQACEEAVELEDQQTCISDVGDQARIDVEDRLSDELVRISSERTRERLEGEAAGCREAIGDLVERVRNALAGTERPAERRSIIQDAIDDLRQLVDRCSNDLDEREREGDGEREGEEERDDSRR